MKKGRRIISAIILLAMIVSMIPARPMVSAATGVAYVLDTDGIDAGEEYLLVKKANKQDAYYALQGADSTNPGASAMVTLDADQVLDFDGIENYLWTVEDNGAGAYNIRHGDRYLHITQWYGETDLAYKEEQFALSINNNDNALQKNGEYNIYCKFAGDYYHYFVTAKQSDPSIFVSNRVYSAGYIDSCVRFYKKVETQQIHTVSVLTKLNNNNTDLSAIFGENAQLHVSLDGSNKEYLPMTVLETGVYAAEVTEYGIYSVYIVDAAGAYTDTGKDVTVGDLAELSYYSVTYDAAGGTLHTERTTEIYLAGARVTAQAAPARDGYEFRGWMDQKNNTVAAGDLVTESLQEAMSLTAQWEEIKIDESLKTSYVIRYLEKGTYKQLQGDTSVTDAAAGYTLIASQQAPNLTGYTYVGATINGVFIEKEKDPKLTLSLDGSKNVLLLIYMPDPDLRLHKEAILENDGTYTIEMEMFTHNNPVTTLVEQDVPLDIVLVLDQSSSMWTSGVYEQLQKSVDSFIDLVADHGRTYKTDHRIAVVGYGNPGVYGATGTGPIAGSSDRAFSQTIDGEGYWTNTGIFDAHGDFHVYPVTGFNYTAFEGEVKTNGTYYTFADGEYLLLTYHEKYRHMITEDEAYTELLRGTTIYGYVDGAFVELRRNDNGMWVVTNTTQLYSSEEFFTEHLQVWTHRQGIQGRKIHAYMVDGQFQEVDHHTGIFVRAETNDANPDKSIYNDALIPVTMGAKGSGYIDPSFDRIVANLGAKGQTYVNYGMKMANSIFEANAFSREDEEAGRRRIVVVFTDGKPGDSTNFDEEESNAAIYEASIATGTYGARVFTVGIYGEEIVAAESDQDYFMNGLSSNYPDAQSLDDVWSGIQYIPAQAGIRLNMGGPYYVKQGENFVPLRNVIGKDETTPEDQNYYSFWKYTDSNGNEVTLDKSELNKHPVITAVEVDGEMRSWVNGVDIYRKSGIDYQEAASNKYYIRAEEASELEQDFATIVQALTTKISEEVTMENDAILRDIMGQGLVLTPGSVITVYSEKGTFISNEKRVEWSGNREYLDSLVIPENASGVLTSRNGITVDGKQIPYISVYNIDAQNPTDPDGADYHPHTVDIVGYDYSNEEWFLNAASPNGKRLIATITRVEAKDNVNWDRAQSTNHYQSGLWLRKTEETGNYLLEAFVQPSTVFVERAYVLDYGKTFTLGDWYFDSAEGKPAQVVHLDCNIADGMNWFDENAPATENSAQNNTSYGNVKIENGQVHYTPTTTQWGGYDQFYVFGNTWRNTVVTQNANQNGNLWNKVIVIPANNIYYEDSFVTGSSGGVNDISGFVYTGVWETVNGDNAGQNVEYPEHMENEAYGGVHGWTDTLADDLTYSDGSAHVAGINGTMGAKTEFSFTGTGVDIYTRTNQKSGMVVAVLSGNTADGAPVAKSFAIDNLAMSGDYYQIPSVSFENLEYGTYKVTLIATAASNVATGSMRYEYYLDGIRIYNPLGVISRDSDSTVRDAYGKELNAMFTEIRDIVIANDDFIPDLNNAGVTGAVFIDWIQKGQESGDDVAGVGTGTYEVATTFHTYGPKNEVYLAQGQAVVIKVDSSNIYYVGMKTINGGKAAKVNVSGLAMQDPQTITVSHTSEMYYEVTPLDGYIVIQNASEDGALLALTKLRTTNLMEIVATSGVLPITAEFALRAMKHFDSALEDAKNKPVETPETEAVDPLALYKQRTDRLFTTVRAWIEGKGGAV